MKHTHRRTAKGRLGNFDPLIAKLYPIVQGRAVALSMEYVGPRRKNPTISLVTLVPGVLLGMRPEIVQVAILGNTNGACLIDTAKKTGKARLMLAGMPSHLAQALMNALFTIMEQQNGNEP